MSAVAQLLFAVGGGSAPTDPNFASVVQLAHFDGTNGSTTFTNSAGAGTTMTAVGAAALSTTQSKWGGASLRTSGTGSIAAYASGNSAYGFNTGEYTVEGWVRFDNVTTTQDVFAWQDGGSLLRMSSSGVITYRNDSSNRIVSASDVVAATTWHYLSLSRTASNVHWLHVDGVAIGSWTNNFNYGGTGELYAGNSAFGNPLIGYLDDFRVTKGVGRYTGSNYTPPAAAHPDS